MWAYHWKPFNTLPEEESPTKPGLLCCCFLLLLLLFIVVAVFFKECGINDHYCNSALFRITFYRNSSFLHMQIAV